MWISEIGEVEYRADGTIIGQVTYHTVPYEMAFRLAPKVKVDVHPSLAILIAQNVKVHYVKPNAARIVVTYEGGEQSGGVTIGAATPKATEIEVVPSLRENPVEYHEKFEEWRSHALFDPETKEFQGWNFPADSEAAKWFQGMVSYFEPTVTVRRSYVADRPPDLSRIRTIFSSIDGIPKIDDRDWLLLSLPYRDLGNGKYPITEEYLLSGKSGWNPYVYGDRSM